MAVTAVNLDQVSDCAQKLYNAQGTGQSDMRQTYHDVYGPAQQVIRLYGQYAVTHAVGQVEKLEAMRCYAAASAWRAMLKAIENLQAAQKRCEEKLRDRDADK